MTEYTYDQIAEMELVGYERTKADAMELKKDYEQEHPGVKCVVIGSKVRARKNKYDKPWQVRVRKSKGAGQ